MLDVKKVLTNILVRLYPTNMFVIEAHTCTTQHTTNASTKQESSYTVSKPGYYPIGIVGHHHVWISGDTAKLNDYSMYISSRAIGSATIFYASYNFGTSAVKWQMRCYILWMKI